MPVFINNVLNFHVDLQDFIICIRRDSNEEKGINVDTNKFMILLMSSLIHLAPSAMTYQTNVSSSQTLILSMHSNLV